FLVSPRRGQPPPEPVRGQDGGLDAAISPPSGAALAEPPGELRWAPQRDAVAYRLKLFDAAGNALFTSDRLQAPRLVPPPNVRARLERGQRYFWSVDVEGTFETTHLGSFWFGLSSR